MVVHQASLWWRCLGELENKQFYQTDRSVTSAINQVKMECHFSIKPGQLKGIPSFYHFLLLVFSVALFKIDQIENENRSTDKVQNL